MLSIKTKQVLGVTLMVTLSVVVLTAWGLAALIDVHLTATASRASLIAKTLSHRATAVARGAGATIDAITVDPGMQSILQASTYSDNVLYASVVDPSGIVKMDSLEQNLSTEPLPGQEDLASLLSASAVDQVTAIYWPREGRRYELREPLVADQPGLGSIRIGVSTLFIRGELERRMLPTLYTAGAIILLAALLALLLAQLSLRPIHVITSGLARLGRGELDVNVDLPTDADLGDLGDSFKAVSARLTADRTALVGQRATLESVVDHLEDAVAVFSPDGTLLFANEAMQPLLGAAGGHLSALFPPDHACRMAVEDVLADGQPVPPQSVQMGDSEFLLLTHPVGAPETPPGAVVVARNLTLLGQVESTITYSRKLAALGRLSAGIAHEVKNPLNATMIHLELLRMRLAEIPDALEHVRVIAAQVRRLDEVVQGLLKFTRPEDVKLLPIAIAPVFEELMPVVAAEASKSHVDVRLEIPDDLPPARADSGLLQQVFLNLALNACQAMPQGGRLRIAARVLSPHRLEVIFEDSGTGMTPEQLSRIFDLYYTTKETGSGIGLSLVYRAVQLQDGEIEVASSPGHGTTFRVVLPAAKRQTPFASLAAS